MSKIFQFSWADLKGALVSGLLMALLVVLIQVLNSESIYVIDWKMLANAGVFAFLTSIVSFLKSILTTSNGKFVDVVQVK